MFQDLSPAYSISKGKMHLEFILVPYWRVLKLSFASVSPSVCLSPLKFYTLFFSLCFWRIIWNSLNSFKMSNIRSGLYFCCVWSTYYRENNFFTFYFLTIGFDVYWINVTRMCLVLISLLVSLLLSFLTNKVLWNSVNYCVVYFIGSF